MLRSQNRVLESDEAVLFRLTRNIVKVLEASRMGGPLIASMLTALRIVQKKADSIEIVAELVLRH